tara:strand:- start:3111 stop:4229 length:1119 start_codon:yes stop_codon:yes gene_type:complete
MSVQVSYSKQFGLGIILLIIIFVIVEIFAYVIMNERDSCGVGLWESGLYDDYSENFVKSLCADYKSIIDFEKPYKHWEPDQKTDTVNINSFGIRGEEFNLKKESDTYRIVMLGGSTMYGVYATSDSATIPSFLEKKIEKENPNFNIEIINAGINGSDSFDEVSFLTDRLLNLEPDMIFIYDGGNDLLNKISNEEILTDPWPTEIEKFSKQIRNYYKTTHLIEFLDRIIQKNIFNEQNKKIETISEDKIKQKIILWGERWSEFCHKQNIDKKDIIVAVQPYLGTGEKEFSNWEKNTKLNNMRTDVAEHFPTLVDQLKIIEKKCTKTLDLTDSFDKNSGTIFYDLIHVGDKGNEIMAERIYDEILPILKNRLNK